MEATDMKQFINKFAIALLTVCFTASASRGDNPKDFTLESPTHGTKFTLSQAKEKHVALHFLLKTECPFCLKHTHDYAALAATTPNVVHLFIKPDSAAEIKKWSEHLDKEGLKDAPVIYRDADEKLAEAFGIPDGYRFHGQVVRYPALVVLGPDGKEVFRYVGKSNTDRMSVADFTRKLAETKPPTAARNVTAAVGNAEFVASTPGLVAFWTFGEEAGEPRVSTGTKQKHSLAEVNGPISRVEGGPYSGYSAELNGKQWFSIPHAETGDLNICGPDAQVSMFAVVRIVNLKQSRTIAGMWSEGKGANDDTGTRQYALLMNMPTYGGPNKLTPHISSEGGVTRRADGSAFPWCADYAASAGDVPTDRWCTLGFTYDGKFIRAYINGLLDAQTLDPEKHKRTDRYFTQEGPNGGDRGLNPYYHGRGIFRYDAAKHGETKIKPSDFTVGARMAVGSMTGEATIGRFGGLAVFNRVLTDDEMLKLHGTARVEKIQP